MTELLLCAPTLDLCFTRGDTFAWTITLTDEAGVALTIPMGNTYKITVNVEQDPTTTTNEIFDLIGVVLPQMGATLGKIQFAIQTTDWTAFDMVLTAPVEAYCDLQETDSMGARRSLGKGKFTVDQDITK